LAGRDRNATKQYAVEAKKDNLVVRKVWEGDT